MRWITRVHNLVEIEGGFDFLLIPAQLPIYGSKYQNYGSQLTLIKTLFKIISFLLKNI